MSVQSEIDRINGEVNSQSTIIDQISSVLDSKSPSNMLSSGAIVTNSVSTPLQNNTTKLQALKEKADSLPEYVPPAKLQEKTVTPTKEGVSVVPDSGFDGMSKVTVNGDANLVPENIKEGVSIFGVIGNLKAGTTATKILVYANSDDGNSYTQIVNVGTLCTAIVGTTDNFATEDNGVARTLNGDIVKRESWKREGKYACKITFIAPSESVVVTWD